MKKIKYIVISLFILLGLFACKNPFSPIQKETPKGKPGSLTINFTQNLTRSIMPDFVNEIKSVKVTLTLVDDENGTKTIEVFTSIDNGKSTIKDIPYGRYNLSVIVYNEDDGKGIEIATGSVDKVVVGDTHNTIPVKLEVSAKQSEEGRGNLLVTIDVENLPVVDLNYFSISLVEGSTKWTKEDDRNNLLSGERGGIDSESVSYDGNIITIEKDDLPSGDYYLSVSYTYAGEEYETIFDSIVKIYNGLTSEKEVTATTPYLREYPYIAFNYEVTVAPEISADDTIYVKFYDAEELIGYGIGEFHGDATDSLAMVEPKNFDDKPLLLKRGGNYKYKAFVDLDGVYEGFVITEENIEALLPHADDIATVDYYDRGLFLTIGEDLELATVEIIFDYNPSFSYNQIEPIFVSDEGDEDGRRYDRATSFEAAFDMLESPDFEEYRIYILEDIDVNLASGFSINSNVRILSLGDSPYTISFTGSLSQGSVFNVNSGQSNTARTLCLENIILNGHNLQQLTNPGIKVGGSASLIMNNATIEYFINSAQQGSYGGGIHAYDSGTVNLENGSIIRNCEAGYGGGIYVADNGTLIINGTGIEISENRAELNEDFGGDGGGIYLAGVLTIEEGADYSITRNHAGNQGGGIWISKDAHVEDDENSLKDNCKNNTAANDEDIYREPIS